MKKKKNKGLDIFYVSRKNEQCWNEMSDSFFIYLPYNSWRLTLLSKANLGACEVCLYEQPFFWNKKCEHSIWIQEAF